MFDYPFGFDFAGRHCNGLPERGKRLEMADFVGSAARAEDLGGAVNAMYSSGFLRLNGES
jgi:hypothetical protein